MIRSVLINTKSLQDATISFRPELPNNNNTASKKCISAPASLSTTILDISSSQDTIGE